jgi:hypothetical protein
MPTQVRIADFQDGECFDILLDGKSQTVTCDADTVLTGVCNFGHHCCLLLQGCTEV